MGMPSCVGCLVMGIGLELKVGTQEENIKNLRDRLNYDSWHYYTYTPESFLKMMESVPLSIELLQGFYVDRVKEVKLFTGSKPLEKNGKGQGYLRGKPLEWVRDSFSERLVPGLTVEIDDRQNLHQKCVTFVHEAIHGIYGVGGYTSKEESEELEKLIDKSAEEFYCANYTCVEDLFLSLTKDKRQGLLFEID